MKAQLENLFSEPGRMSRIVGIVMGINLVNVVFALLKDVLIASFLGTSEKGDSFFLAFFIPDTLWNNIFSTSIAVALIPLVIELMESGKKAELRVFLKQLLKTISIIAFSVGLFLFVFSTPLLELLGNHLGNNQYEIAGVLLKIMLPLILIYPIISVLMSMLQVRGAYIKSAIGPLLLNVVWFSLILLLTVLRTNGESSLYFLSGIVCIAAFLELSYLGWMSGGARLKYSAGTDGAGGTGETKGTGGTKGTDETDRIDVESPELGKKNQKKYWAIFNTYFSMLLILQIVQFYERYLGMGLGEGSISAISYANRLSQFPTLVFSYSVALVVFPEISRAISDHKEAEARQIYFGALKTLLRITIPVSIGMVVLREPLISILFQRNAFNEISVRMTGDVLFGYGAAMLWQVFLLLSIRVLVAIGIWKKPLFYLFLAAIVNGVLDRILIDRIGIFGIGIGAAVGAFIASVLILITLSNWMGGSLKRGAAYFLKIGLANAPVLLFAFFAKMLWESTIADAFLLKQIAFGLAAGGACMLIAWLGYKYLGIKPSEKKSGE